MFLIVLHGAWAAAEVTSALGSSTAERSARRPLGEPPLLLLPEVGR